jgi:hypothetical protein
MADINEKLDILYDLLVENYPTLQAELINLIQNPSRIQDSNKFSSLISDLKDSSYIEPLLAQINLAENNDPWLTDFLYALIELLDESSVSDEFAMPKGLISKLENWILDHTGELPWKAAALLKFYDSDQAEAIQLKKLDQEDFFLTHVECVLGLVHRNKAKYIELVGQIAKDQKRDERLRNFCEEIIHDADWK